MEMQLVPFKWWGLSYHKAEEGYQGNSQPYDLIAYHYLCIGPLQMRWIKVKR